MMKLPPPQRDVMGLTRQVLARVTDHRVTTEKVASFRLIRRRQVLEPAAVELDGQVSDEGQGSENESGEDNGGSDNDEVSDINDGSDEEEESGLQDASAIKKLKKKKYQDNVSGYQYSYKCFLNERYVDGELQVLVEWEPTWEPAANIRLEDLHIYHDDKRAQRCQRRSSHQC
ncbi:hypothetical protein P43SY_010488 [Pythium insidiosum]|uniref:Chromo domain-containing protein n=1 Tax=Pythium insidiosum TaxID=114742 RepID=A0AAD5LS95_PYTIN|nr:hypothetical protein P43SY_010488 [Pythium insidiosum]